jgi:hypothetical protein
MIKKMRAELLVSHVQNKKILYSMTLYTSINRKFAYKHKIMSE